jgi:uncharacterized delta-60 repeat protein
MLSAGDLDLSFGGDGVVSVPTKVEIDVDGGTVLPGDKLLINGGIRPDDSQPDYMLRQFNADGTVDKTFGGGDGIASGRLNGIPVRLLEVQVTSAGKILGLAHDRSDNPQPDDLFIVRFNADGSLDTTFSDDGFFAYSPAGGGFVFTVQANGGVLVGAGNDLLRYTADGDPDPTFGIGGKMHDPLGAIIAAVRELPDGRIIVGGTNSDSPTERTFVLARINANGSIDASFGAGGKVITDVTPGQPDPFPLLRNILVQPDGKIIATGEVGELLDGGTGQGAVRYNADGDLDPTFGSGGRGEVVIIGGTAQESYLDANGRIYLTTFGGYVTRLNANGTFDETFGRVYGNASFPVGVQASGRFITAGSTDSRGTDSKIFLVGRQLEDDGTPTPIALSNRVLTIIGTSGDDFIQGGVGARVGIFELNGFGRVFDPADIDRIDAVCGDGNDIVKMDAHTRTPAHISGGLGRDKIVGTAANDTLEGNGGRDFIDGGLGADLIIGNAGNDQLRGQGGADHIYGRAGNDHLQGNGGNDRLDGGDGIDTLRGGAGNDIFAAAGGGVDQLFGDAGSDSATADDEDILTSIESAS